MSIAIQKYNHRRAVIGLLALLLLAGCATPVKTEYDREISYEPYRSFAWMAPLRVEVEDPALDSELLDRRVQRLVTEALTEAGFQQTDPETADFLVTYRSSSREAVSGGTGLSIGVGTARRGGGTAVCGGLVVGGSRPQTVTTLMIDIIDREQNMLVWRGWRESDRRQDRYDDSRLKRLIEAIVAEFPPERE